VRRARKASAPVGGRPAVLVVVVGTGTEVGKTWVAARLLEHWRRGLLRVAARKPAQSMEQGADTTDAAVLGAASGEAPEVVCLAERSYPTAMAPPIAARALGRPPIHLGELRAELRWPEPPPQVGLVETAGGLRSPQAEDGDALDFTALLRPDLVVLVAEAGLGTISAVRLCADALSARGLPCTVVLNRYDDASPLHAANRGWLRDRDGLGVVPGTPEGLEALAQRIAARATSPAGAAGVAER
jgi:dethiobiotin synthetase